MFLVRPIWPEGYGERLLLASIIRRAAYDIALYKGSSRLHDKRTWEDAYRWLMSDREDYFTSFRSICSVLNQDHHFIRRSALRLTRQDVKKYDMVDAHGRV
jgi:hypothetical protein